MKLVEIEYNMNSGYFYISTQIWKFKVKWYLVLYFYNNFMLAMRKMEHLLIKMQLYIYGLSH